jgi:D-serine dehydratase
MAGPWRVAAHARALSEQGISAESLAQATHLVWATGGGMVPAAEMAKYLAAGQAAE